MNSSGGQTMKSAPSSSSRPGDIISDQFPAGLRVLVVDDDPTCLRILDKMLKNCLYQVTQCNRAEIALAFLRENKNGYDIVISDVHMPDMDGFKLLEHVGLEMDLPVIMMSADDSKNVVMKGVTHGACDYLIKPVRMEALKNIWQHVVRKKKRECKDNDVEQLGSVEDGGQQQKPSEDVEHSSSGNEGNWRSSKKRKDDEDDETEDKDDSSALKKPRVVWSVELHQQFVTAVNQLGIDKAVPKKILEMMNVAGLTRENVASHLQKYRLYLRRLSGPSGLQSGLNPSYLTSPEAAFRSISLSGLDLQSLAASGQLPSQSLATLQAAVFSRPATTSAMSVPVTDQRNLFSFEPSNMRYVNGRLEASNNDKKVSLLQGSPINMDPKQLANLHSVQPFWGMSGSSQVDQISSPLMQITQLQSRGQLLNQANSSQVLRSQFSNGPTLANAIPRAWSPKGVERGAASNQVSQGTSIVDFSMKQNTELAGTSFPLLSDSGMPTHSSKPLFQGELISEIKDSTIFHPGYDQVNELHLQQTSDWSMQNATFDASQHLAFQGANDAPCSVFSLQDFSSTPNGGQRPNGPVSKGLFSGGDGQNNSLSMGPVNPLLSDTSRRITTERLTDPGCQSNHFSKSFGHDDDLMGALLKQQENDVIPDGKGSGIDGYSLGNHSS